MFVLGFCLIFVCALILLLLAKLYFRLTNGICTSDVDLSGKVILITGGNGGIGKEYVRDMARRNAKIIMACRNVEKGYRCAKEISEETKNSNISVEKCDLSSLQSVKEFCYRIKKRENKIDFLICFAAAVGVPVDQKFTGDGLETQFQCNYLSHFVLILHCVQLLKKSDSARIVLTSSSAHLLGKIDLANISRFEKYEKNPFMSYGDSKLALVMLGKELTERLAGTKITVNSFHPGTVYTDGVKNIKIWYLKWFLSVLAFLYGKSFEDGAQTLIYLTVSEDVAGVSGYYFSDCQKATHNQAVDNRQLRQELWNLSVDLIKPYIEPHQTQI